jgi:predicted Zn-dependent protease
MYSPEQDIQLGRQAAAQVRQQVDVVDNADLQNYVGAIGKRLAATRDAGKYPYTFTLINDKNINAFALPGGPVFINSGTIAAADNEAQLAGVMAHEIAHVALRHGTNQASKANILQVPAAIAGAVLGQGGAAAQLGQIGLGVGLNALILKYSRTAESQADALGSHIMAEAGYNPVEMAQFFEKLEAEGGSGAPQFLSDHPNPGNRVRAVQAEIRTLPQADYTEYRVADATRFKHMKQLVAQLPPPRRGVQRAGAEVPQAPTGGYQQLQAGTFTLEYPNGWQPFEDKQTGTVAIGPRQGFIQDASGKVSIGYGALLSVYKPARNRDLRQATAELIQTLQQSNPAMRASSNPAAVTVSGHSGLITNLTAESPYGGAERDVLLTVAKPEGLFYMVFIAPDRSWAQLQPIFEHVAQSIRFPG